MASNANWIRCSFQRLAGLTSFNVRSESRNEDLRVALAPGVATWHRVDSELHQYRHHHQQWWWKRSGYALAVFLNNAGYSAEMQYQSLQFFASVVAPSLGVSQSLSKGQLFWRSFMTDDGIPIEISWDWGTDSGPPTIRYSIEPIGVNAGTPSDRDNQYAASEFHGRLLSSLPGVHPEWFEHFRSWFKYRACNDSLLEEGHSSQVFYAFDLVEKAVTSKAYFFPAFTAREKGQSRLAEILQAIQAAPHCTTEGLHALLLFNEYAAEKCNSGLEFEMLAIDLIDPLKSRFKIYFRSRDTSFSSVTHVMTLGGRVRTKEIEKGLHDLRFLWNSIFKVDDRSQDILPQSTDHRTAGILYNIEFKLGSVFPTVKVYLPVRHYAGSDEEIIQGLGAYLQHHQRDRYMSRYINVMQSLL